jgi:hypothetical protein
MGLEYAEQAGFGGLGYTGFTDTSEFGLRARFGVENFHYTEVATIGERYSYFHEPSKRHSIELERLDQIELFNHRELDYDARVRITQRDLDEIFKSQVFLTDYRRKFVM